MCLLALVGGQAWARSAPVCNGQFHWVDVAGTECLDGSPTGIVYRCFAANGRNGPLLVHVDGGGACWDHDTCACGPDTDGIPGFNTSCPLNLQSNHFGSDDVFGYVDVVSNSAMFTGPTSPFDGWNQVFLPYCTGDVHSGRALHDFGDYPAHFSGYDNMTLELATLASLFPRPSRVASLGDSGGAYGVDCNLSQFAAAWPSSALYELAVSEVPFDSLEVPLMPAASATWGAIHSDGGLVVADTCPFAPSALYQLRDVEAYNRAHFPAVRKGLVAFYADAELDWFACALGATPDHQVSCARAIADSLTNALDFAVLDPSGAVDPAYKVFFAKGTCHDYLGDDGSTCSYDTITSQGVRLDDWVRGWMEVPGYDWPLVARH
jgi:hypothetical protein